MAVEKKGLFRPPFNNLKTILNGRPGEPKDNLNRVLLAAIGSALFPAILGLLRSSGVLSISDVSPWIIPGLLYTGSVIEAGRQLFLARRKNKR